MGRLQGVGSGRTQVCPETRRGAHRSCNVADGRQIASAGRALMDRSGQHRRPEREEGETCASRVSGRATVGLDRASEAAPTMKLQRLARLLPTIAALLALTASTPSRPLAAEGTWRTLGPPVLE